MLSSISMRTLKVSKTVPVRGLAGAKRPVCLRAPRGPQDLCGASHPSTRTALVSILSSVTCNVVAGPVPRVVHTGGRAARAQCFISDAAAPYESYNLHAPSADSGEEKKQAVNYDFLVIGSGIAGLTYALKVAESGSVAVITKESVSEGCTAYAQGGVCAVLDPLDSVQDHMHDTIVAGNFLNDARYGHFIQHANFVCMCTSLFWGILWKFYIAEMSSCCAAESGSDSFAGLSK